MVPSGTAKRSASVARGTFGTSLPGRARREGHLQDMRTPTLDIRQQALSIDCPRPVPARARAVGSARYPEGVVGRVGDRRGGAVRAGAGRGDAAGGVQALDVRDHRQEAWVAVAGGLQEELW